MCRPLVVAPATPNSADAQAQPDDAGDRVSTDREALADARARVEMLERERGDLIRRAEAAEATAQQATATAAALALRMRELEVGAAAAEMTSQERADDQKTHSETEQSDSCGGGLKRARRGEPCSRGGGGCEGISSVGTGGGSVGCAGPLPEGSWLATPATARRRARTETPRSAEMARQDWPFSRSGAALSASSAARIEASAARTVFAAARGTERDHRSGGARWQCELLARAARRLCAADPRRACLRRHRRRRRCAGGPARFGGARSSAHRLSYRDVGEWRRDHAVALHKRHRQPRRASTGPHRGAPRAELGRRRCEP